MSNQQTCASCGFTHQCLCARIPRLISNAYIALLTHENELHRDTNTGKWLQASLAHCSIHIWQRKSMPISLNELIEREQLTPFLLFPDEESITVESITEAKNSTNIKPLFVVLDATWQEAKKMARKSHWLADWPKVSLEPKNTSQYTLRRNQDSGHLCTLEVGSEILAVLGHSEDAQQLNAFFDYYLKAYQADKSGHQLRK